MTGDAVCALFGNLMAGPARPWYLQLMKSTRTSWTELMDQFRVHYCGKGVTMVSRYYHASKHVDETPLEYLYRLNVAGMRAKIRYSDGMSKEKREHVELFISTLGAQEQELASRLTLIEVPDTATLEKKLRAAVHAVQIASDDYDSGREGDSDDDQICDQDRDDEERAKMFVTGHAPQQENARRDFETGGSVHDRPTCRHCGSHRHSEGDCWGLLTCQKCAGQHPPDRCLRACTSPHAVHAAGKCSLEEFFNQLHKWYKQAKIPGKLNNRMAVLLLDTGAEVSILDTTFAREVGCQIDTSVTQEGRNVLQVGKTRVKVTLAANMVYYMNLWVGDLVDQNAIFGMNFMVPAGVQIDTADGTACLPDEVRIQIIGRRPLYGSRMRPVTIPSLIRIAAGQTYDVPLRPEKNAPRLWMTRGATRVTSLIKAPVRRRTYLRVTSIGEKSTVLGAHTTIGWRTPIDAVPRAFGIVQPGSRKYDEWQNLVYGATSDVNDEAIFQETSGPMAERREYADPQAILGQKEKPGNSQGEGQGRKVAAIPTVSREDNTESTDAVKIRGALSLQLEHGPRLSTEPEHGPRGDAEPEYGPHLRMGSELFAEDEDAEMAVLLEVPLTTEGKIGDLKIGRPEGVDPDEATEMEERLRHIVWKKRKWLIGKGDTLPPAAKGVICDIDVGNTRPVAQRVRKFSSQFREKLANMFQGLLSARMIRASKSPWASPIVVIVKKNGVDIRLYLLEDLDKYRWYCSLDMVSGFWVVPMSDRARLISSFIKPFGLFEWLRMPFGLCNAPQIYQSLIDNALYGFWKLSPTEDTRDVFKDGVPSKHGIRSVRGRRSYIDDILIGGKSWDDLCEKVERLLEVSENGLGAKPKILEALAALDFPRTQKGLQSFLGSLNYYHRFIPAFAIFATALYSLSASDFEERATNPEMRDVEKGNHTERAFATLRSKIAATPMIKHFDADRQPVVIVSASDWAVLTQEHDGIYMPVKFTRQTLKPNELNYNITEKEILALLRSLNEC
ncbi:reverse transcriptase, partial [Phytophthora megakarya]